MVSNPDSENALRRVLTQLEELNVDYMLVGAFSSNLYGIPRSTNDADIVVSFETINIVEFCRSLGDEFELDPQMMLEGFTGSVRNVVRFAPTDFTIEFFRLNDDAHQQERFRRRRRQKVFGSTLEIQVPTAEDVVIQKLRWARRKDLDDIVNVLSVSGELLDWNYIRRWTDEHATTELLLQLRAEADGAT